MPTGAPRLERKKKSYYDPVLLTTTKISLKPEITAPVSRKWMVSISQCGLLADAVIAKDVLVVIVFTDNCLWTAPLRCQLLVTFKPSNENYKTMRKGIIANYKKVGEIRYILK